MDIRLLPKAVAPAEFRLSRPISFLVTSPKAVSCILLHKAEPPDVGTNGTGKAEMSMQGFRREFQCAELVHSSRAVAEKAMEWNVPVCISQTDFAMPCHATPRSAATCLVSI